MCAIFCVQIHLSSPLNHSLAICEECRENVIRALTLQNCKLLEQDKGRKLLKETMFQGAKWRMVNVREGEESHSFQ